jgi:hypothetical protein
MKFYVEIDNQQKKFSIKSSNSTSLVIYQQSVFDTVLAGVEHKDSVYSSTIDKCADLDCTQFYSSAFVSGSVSLCGDCTPKTTPPRITEPKYSCALEIAMQRVLPQTEPYYEGSNLRCDGHSIPTDLNIRVLNSDALQGYNNYLIWLANASEGPYRIQASRNGFWLGLPVCSGSYQCLVSCDSGSVAGCWNTSGGTGTFGDVYNISGQNYQVYDAIQIALAGIKPKSGSFSILSSNPLSGRTSSSTECGTPVTITNTPNCLSSTPGCSFCEEGSENIGPENNSETSIGVIGDFSGKSFSFENGSCSFAGNNIQTTRFALGGSNSSSITPVTFEQAGIVSAFNSCGDCLRHQSMMAKGANCCPISYGCVTINGAPTWTGSGWTAGGDIWNQFWSSNNDDNNFRLNETVGSCDGGPETCWGSWRSSCEIPAAGVTANVLGTTPCYFLSSSSVSGCETRQKQVSWWRFFEVVDPATCARGLGSIMPGFEKGCGACDNLGDCLEFYDTYGCCTCLNYEGDDENPPDGNGSGIPDTNPFSDRHIASRLLYIHGSDDPDGENPDQTGDGCFTQVKSGLGIGYLKCGNGYEQICCDQVNIEDNRGGTRPEDGVDENGQPIPFTPARCSGWIQG